MLSSEDTDSSLPETETPEATQHQNTQPTQPEPQDEPGEGGCLPEMWGRLIMIAPTHGLHELREPALVIGRRCEDQAQKIADFEIHDHMISKIHCKIVKTPNGCQLIDKSNNGTYVNNQLLGKDKYQTLHTGDELSLLNPSAERHYKYMYQALGKVMQQRRPVPVIPPQAKLLRGTSFCVGDREMATRRSQYDEISKIGGVSGGGGDVDARAPASTEADGGVEGEAATLPLPRGSKRKGGAEINNILAAINTPVQVQPLAKTTAEQEFDFYSAKTAKAMAARLQSKLSRELEQDLVVVEGKILACKQANKPVPNRLLLKETRLNLQLEALEVDAAETFKRCAAPNRSISPVPQWY